MAITLPFVVSNQTRSSPLRDESSKSRAEADRMRGVGLISRVHLSTLLIVTDTDGALTEAVGPVAANVGADLRHTLVRDEEPCAEDDLGHNIEDSVGDDLSVNGDLAGTIGDTPDTESGLANILIESNRG